MWNNIKLLNGLSHLLLALCAVALLAAGLWWLSQRPMFSLQALVVQGIESADLRHVNVLTVRASALPRIKGNFFTANLDAVKAAFESVPWVRKAAVRREWPNKIVVSIEEHRPLGTWGDDGRLLSVKGDVFTANLAEAEEEIRLLEFDGPPGSEKQVLTRYAELREAIKSIGMEPVSVRLSSRFAWTVKTNSGMTIRFGREHGDVTLGGLVSRFREVYPQLAARLGGGIESVDLRYPNGVALIVGGLSPASGVQQK